MGDQVRRHLSIHFSTRNFKGITHEDILNSVLKTVEADTVKSIQITEKECVITLNDFAPKDKLLSSGITVKDRSVKLFDVEKQITNVTIKDAPFELHDTFICSSMSKYGQVVSRSLRRGVIKDTNIETGTRYIQLINCIPILPNRTNFGKHQVRLFADNNRTQCVYCTDTRHPSYLCTRKRVRRCYNCNQTGHQQRECKENPFCGHCEKEGHNKRNCPIIMEALQKPTKTNVQETEQEHEKQTEDTQADVGNVAQVLNDIRLSMENGLDKCENENKNSDVSTSNENGDKKEYNGNCVLIGASNCKRVGSFENITNVSVSGASLERISEAIDEVNEKTESVDFDTVIVCLGTNDVSRNKDDPDQVNANFVTAISEVKNSYPDRKIGICNILPRKGKSNAVAKFNDDVNHVNRFIDRICNKDKHLEMIDIHGLFVNRDDNVIKAMFDSNDPSGIHISECGAQKIRQIFTEFISKADTVIEPFLCSTPGKRNRSCMSTTPASVEKQAKLSKGD